MGDRLGIPSVVSFLYFFEFVFLYRCYKISIYIYKEERLFVCLFVLYAFSPCDSYDHQTFHSASLGPKEGRRGVGMVIGGWGEAG